MVDDLPSFTELFGEVERAEGQGARSVLSPAAYLVDLLQLQDGRVGSGDGAGFHARRPDVASVPLDEGRTFGEVPHLQISNAVLQALAERGGVHDVDGALAGALHPAPLPCSLAEARLSRCLERLGTSAAELQRAFQHPVDGEEAARLRMGLSAPEHALFVTRRDDDAGLAALWGIRDAAERARLLEGDGPLVRKKLGLSVKELKALLYLDLSEAELASGVAATCFVHADPDHPALSLVLDDHGRIRRSDGSAWRPRHLDRAMRFVRLARRLGLGFAELDELLRSIGAVELDGMALRAIAVALELRTRFERPIDEVCSLWAAPRQRGRGDGPEPGDLFDRIFNHGHPTPIDALLAAGPSEALTARVVASLRIGRADHDLLVEALAARGAPPAASVGYLAALYRMTTLAAMLGLGMRELIALLDVLDAQWADAEHDDLAVPVPIAATLGARPVYGALASPAPEPAAALAVVQKVVRLAAWTADRGLSVRQLAFVALDRFDDGAPIDGVLGRDAIEAALDELYQVAAGALVQPGALQTASLTAGGARAALDALAELQVLTVVRDAATPSPRALITSEPTADDLAAAFARGLDQGPPEARASSTLAGEVVELGDRLRAVVEQHRGALVRIAAAAFGVADELVELLLQVGFGAPGEPATRTLASVLVPLFARKAAGARALGSAPLAVGFRRVQQLALLFGTAGFAGDEATVFVANQEIDRRLPEPLELPAGFLDGGRLDAVLPLDGGDLAVIAGPRYARCAGADYRLVDSGPLAALPGIALPPDFAAGLDAAWRDADGTAWFAAGERCVSSAEPTAIRRVADRWGKVRNRIQDERRVDAALTDERGRLFVFRGDQYVRYSDPARLATGPAFVDEGYPRSIRGGFAREQVVALPPAIDDHVDAAFRDGDGSYHVFSGDRWFHSAAPDRLDPLASRWGRVRNRLFDDDRVDAAFVASDRTYLVRGDQIVRYPSPASGFVDEGWPIRLVNLPDADPALRLLRRFADGVDATFTGRDGALNAFRAGAWASSAAPDTRRPIRDRWGRVRNLVAEAGRVDAALAHGGAIYLFAGDQYVRYSGSDRDHVDEGYPRRIRDGWNQLERAGSIPAELGDTVAAVARTAAGELYFFGGTRYAGPDGAVGDVRSRWGRVRNELERLGRVDAALIDSAGRLFLFAGDQVFRYATPAQERVDDGYPRRLTGSAGADNGWSVPAAFAGGISAALRGPDERLYVFGGGQYARIDAATAPAPLARDWGLVRNRIAADNRIDAGFTDPQGRTFLFAGDQFVRYSGGYDAVDDGHPLAIGARWGALPDSFRAGLDVAFWFPVDGVPRLYLFKGADYVRYSTPDHATIDAGYPRHIGDGAAVEGTWFRGFKDNNPDAATGNDPVDIDAVYTDSFAGKPRLVMFYRHAGAQWRREHRYETNRYRWTEPRRVEASAELAPFTRIDAAVVTRDGVLHLFSGEQCASRATESAPLTAPVPTRDRWGRVANQVAQLGRVDATLALPDGRTYLFCDRQYVRYTGALRPGAADFFVDDGYPRTIEGGFALEGVGVELPAAVPADGFALCRDATGAIHRFLGGQYTRGTTTAAVATRWGRVENRIQELGRVDAACTADDGALYLLCDDQYVRYRGAVGAATADLVVDDGYPRRIATGWAGEGLPFTPPARVAALGHAILRDGAATHVFAGATVTTAGDPTARPVAEGWGRVRNRIQDEDRVDAGAVLDGRTYLFAGDQYVRYTGADDGFVDEGYPKVIARFGVAEGRAPLAFPDGVAAIFPAGDTLHAFSRPADPAEPQRYAAPGTPEPVAPRTRWGILDNRIRDRGFVDAALRTAGGALYLFGGGQFVRYADSAQPDVDEGYPRAVGTSWAAEVHATGLPAVLAHGIDAVATAGGVDHYFVEDQVVTGGVARRLIERWGLVDNRLQQTSRLDGACLAPDGRLYLFSGDQVAAYSGADRAYVDEGYPRAIARDVGRAWPARFQRDLDAAFTFAGRAFLVAGDQHVRISDLRLRAPDDGYPMAIAAKLGHRPAFALGALPDVARFRELIDGYPSLLAYLAGPDHDAEHLAAATRWPAAELAALIAAAPPIGRGLDDARTIAALARAFGLAGRLGATPASLRAQLGEPMVGAARDLAAAADGAHGLVKGRTPPADWPAVERALRDPLLAIRRDALVAYLVAARGLDDADDLYQLVLHDVSMGESATTSPVIEAAGSVQLYYHRALMNLEQVGPGLRGDLASLWPWMKNYRIWEANRKVFLHPENYLRPELRTIKSPAFEELEQSLLQDSITDASVRKAYATYLKEFARVSRLRIAGGYVYRDGRGERYVLVFGFARTEPLTYYWRRGRLPATGPIAWTPWQKIGITINAERVQPVYAFNKIHLFWIEPRFTNDTQFAAGGRYGGDGDAQTAQPVIKYSFEDANAEWISPQTLRARITQRDGRTSWPLDEIEAARLYLSNPVEAGDADPVEHIYVMLGINNHPDPLVGRLTAALDFEQRRAIGSGDAATFGAIEADPPFPSYLGVVPDAVARWGVDFGDVVTSPWFSFDAAGGSFLCVPADPPPIASGSETAIELRGRAFAQVDAGFGTPAQLFVFTTEGGVARYHRRSGAHWQEPVDSAEVWGRAPGFFTVSWDERVTGAVVVGPRTFLLTTSTWLTYPSTDYRWVEQATAAELTPGRPALADLLGGSSTVRPLAAVLDDRRELVRAFALDGKVVVLTRTDRRLDHADATLDDLKAACPAIAAWTRIDTVFVAGTGPERHLGLTSGRALVRLTWATQAWSSTTLDALGVPAEVTALSAAFTGGDGTLYVFDRDRYAAIVDGAMTDDGFGSVADRWGQFRPLAAVDAALLAPGGTLHLFVGRHCLRYAGFDPDAPTRPVLSDDVPRRLVEVWNTVLDEITAAIQLGAVTYLFGRVGGVAKYERYSSTDGDGPYLHDPGYPKPVDGRWGNLPESYRAGFDAGVQVVGADAEDGELYLIRPGDRTMVHTAGAARPFERENIPYTIVRLTSNTAARFSRTLLGLGVGGLLSLATQRTAELPRFSTDARDRGRPHVVVGTDDTKLLPRYPREQHGLDFDSANGFYYWEIFFHIPYLIAQALNQAQRFDEARTWYEYVFDPTETSASPAGRDFWKFLPFHDATDGSGTGYLEDPDQLARYREDPFDPHGLAQLRPIAYRKAFVMSYIDNLLDWGDLLFQQYTRESVAEATMLYVLAADLLGRRPQEVGKRRLALGTLTYGQLRGEQPIPAELLELENTLPAEPTAVRVVVGTPNDTIVNPYFYVPENQQFIDYWDRVSDRLTKIRGGLNFEGVRQSLALLASPVDVMAAVAAFASGAGAAGALADLSAPVPHYRFGFMLAKARELAARTAQLGGALLGALEKQDAEELSLLRSGQERTILEMTLAIKQDQRDAARQSLAGLRINLKSARTRLDHYQKLLSEGLSGYEISQLAFMGYSQGFAMVGASGSIVASLASLIPNLGSPFAITFGGMQLGPSAKEHAEAAMALSQRCDFLSSLSALLGGWDRRKQDWTLQRNLANHEIDQIERQIAASEIQVAIAQKEIDVQRRQIRHNQSVETFMRSKFTSRQLYRWMVGKLAAAHFQTYQLALDHAKAAQRALQFETGWPEDEVQYVGAYYWDSLRKGLLAGERLQLDLDRMEKAHLEKNRRRFELTKTISLMQLDALALVRLQQTGTCELELPEALFDRDFPGHYCRQIKTVSVSFPAVIGPYQNLNATLTQLGHRTVLRPDLDAVKYLVSGAGDAPATIRADWRPTQQVALSRGVNDSGLFQLNYQDERYLPFEGTGAVSRWRLQLDGADAAVHRAHLRDVIVTLQYTALPGGDDFGAKVTAALPAVERARMIQVAYDFPDQWQAFLRDPTRGLVLEVGEDQLPGVGRGPVTALYLHHDLTAAGAAALGRQSMRLDDVELIPDTLRTGLALGPGTWTLTPTGRTSHFTAQHLDNLTLIAVYTPRGRSQL